MQSSYVQENPEVPEVSSCGPIHLNQLLKSKNDNYLKQLVNPKSFPIMLVTPGFDDSALVDQEENAPFNIISLPININETEANDVWELVFSSFILL